MVNKSISTTNNANLVPSGTTAPLLAALPVLNQIFKKISAI
jgi:hypothetical protein